MMIKDLPINRDFMDGVPFFNFMNQSQKDSIAQGLLTQKFKQGENIVNEGNQADSFYMITEGTVMILKEGKEIRTLGPRDSFGEQALYV